MTLWKEIYPQVATLLKDEVSPNRKLRYEEKDVRTWWNHGQTRLSTKYPLQKHMMYAGEDGDVQSLPEHFYKPVGVYPHGSSQSFSRLSIVQAFSRQSQGYYVFEGKLIMANMNGQLPGKFMLLYHAYYPPLKNKQSVVEVPLWAQEALNYYVLMQAITREAVADARYRKFTSPEDAGGNPTHNPFIPVARWCRDRFYEIVNIHVDDDEDYE